MIEILAFAATHWWQNKPRFGLITCQSLRISGFCIATRCWRSWWMVDHGVRGCYDWVKEVAFHKLARLELWVFSLGWRFCLRHRARWNRRSGNSHDLLREFVNSIMSDMFMTRCLQISCWILFVGQQGVRPQQPIPKGTMPGALWSLAFGKAVCNGLNVQWSWSPQSGPPSFTLIIVIVSPFSSNPPVLKKWQQVDVSHRSWCRHNEQRW